MTTPTEFVMSFNFKLVYTCIIKKIEISSNATVHDLFDNACGVFADCINYDKYYIDYVVVGQDKGELAEAFGENNLYQQLWLQFRRWKEVSFYVRPVSRETDTFIRMYRYIEEPDILEARDPEVPEFQNLARNILDVEPEDLII